ncbi:hypothetical protein C8R46DRAFT_1222618 [Mycena filopes]|nr:hypothetical protein C8R46DRAFT_1222618 [Mycena filopes]
MQYQLDRADLAHDLLLQFSRVCSRWHSVAIGTPSLWADIPLTDCLVSTESRTAATISLLRSALERAGNISLILTIPQFLPDCIFDLLSAHSEQWRHFTGTLDCLEYFLAAEGTSFPRLEVLDVDLPWDHLSGLSSARMPNVRTLSVSCLDSVTAAAFPTFSFTRLTSFHFINDINPEQRSLIASLPQLSPDVELRITVTFWEDEPLLDAPLTWNIQTFILEFDDPFEGMPCKIALESIVAEITLPHLLHFTLESNNWPFESLPWPHREFISLCARSAFHTRPCSLDISPVSITEPQLLECLLALPALEKLSISDAWETAADPVEPLISNKLLMQLSVTAESPPLVPRLISITLYSQLRFDHNIFLAFVTSRSAIHRFTIQLGKLTDKSTRDLDLAVQMRLEELKAGGRIGFQIVEPAFCFNNLVT